MTTPKDNRSNGKPTRKEPILVTGGCGFIGHHLVRVLAERGHTVRVLDDLSTGSLDRLPDHPAVTFLEGSVLNADEVRKAADGIGLVFHLASVVGMLRATADPAFTYEVATEGTSTVLEETGDVPAVLFSSSAVYGLVRGEAVREEDSLPLEDALDYDGGKHGYACGKWSTEKIGLDAAAQGRKVMILRPFNVVGHGQSGSYGMVLPRFLNQARAGEPLTVYDDGQQRRCFSEVGTFVETLLRLVHAPESWQPRECVFNVGSAESTAIGDLARLVLAATGSSSPIIQRPFSEVFPGKQDVRDRIPNTDRVSKLIGTVDWPTMEEIVRGVAADAEAQHRADHANPESLHASNP